MSVFYTVMLNSLRPSVVLYEGGFQHLNNEIPKQVRDDTVRIQDDKLDSLNCASYNSMQPYQPKQFEKDIQKSWDREEVYKTREDFTEKEYVLVMFPYPSGSGLHTGHARVYIGTDVIARFHRMNGKAVLHPMGWDAFGLPAENAAIKLGKNPDDLTKEYIANFKRQMQLLGLSYDWNKELSTSDPEYYKITQWLFIQFFKAGLLYKKNTQVNFCEFCKTGLAQEEVLSDGTHERCGNAVTTKNLPQWIFRITKYADRLLDELEGLDWPKGILEMQKNWIGKKEGFEVNYKIEETDQKVTCFTTRLATNFGATFIVLAPEHEFVSKILDKKISSNETDVNAIREYVEKSLSKSEIDRMVNNKTKTGVFTGFYAINELSHKRMPIWVSDFVLKDFGTGAVVGVPGHDLKDFDFAKTFGLEVIRVIKSNEDEGPIIERFQVEEDEGIMVNSDFLNGTHTTKAIEIIKQVFETTGDGRQTDTYHLRDWIFSRQRYWGEPIPIVFCLSCALTKKSYFSENKSKNVYPNSNKIDQKVSSNWEEIESQMHGWFPINEQDLPLKLPYLDKYAPSGTGEPPLSQAKDWAHTTCPNCGGSARRETDTMPNWAGSSWYYLAFAMDPVPSSKYKVSGKERGFNLETWNLKLKTTGKSYLPVDWYIGGAEHAVLHLLYARFWTKILFDLGYINFKEPFLKLRSVGIVIAEDHRKMSKSYGNVVKPDSVIEEYGCDTLRVYEMFMAPFDQEITWSTDALQGSYRFIKRVWHIYNDSAKIDKDGQEIDKNVVTELQKTIAKITSDITDVKFNTCVSSMMQFLNVWEAGGAISKSDAKKFLQVLAPFAPFISDYLWREILGESISIHVSEWPKADNSSLKSTTVQIPVQVDGKLRDVLEIVSDISEDEFIGKAIKSDKVARWLQNEYEIKYIPGRILNFVNK